MRSRSRLAAYAILWCVMVVLPALFPGCDVKDEDEPIVPLYGAHDATAIPNRYIVALPRDAPEETFDLVMKQAKDLGGTIGHQYWLGFRGFSAELPDIALKALRHNPHIAFISANHSGTITGVQSCPPAWGIDRISERTLPLDGLYPYDTTGAGVAIYVLDTGIRQNHGSFGNRVVGGTCSVEDIGGAQMAGMGCPPAKSDPNQPEYGDLDADDSNWADFNEHGTHLAGIAGGTAIVGMGGSTMPGTDVGVAKGVSLYAVRVAWAETQFSKIQVSTGDMAHAIEWVVGNHAKKNVGQHKSIILIGASSNVLGGDKALSVEVEAAIDEGIVVVTSAGNDDGDACLASPGGSYDPAWISSGWSSSLENRAITVGAHAVDDERWAKSNHGVCVDLYAPGDKIKSATVEGCDLVNTAAPCNEFKVMDGTSQAAAHVAGVVAVQWAAAPGASATEIADQVIADASVGPIGRILFSRSKTGSPDMSKPDDGCNDGVAPCSGEDCNFCVSGQACCDGFQCGRGIVCANGTCEACGWGGEPCCLGNSQSSAGVCINEGLFACDVATNRCVCGGFGQPCCGGVGGACDGGLECNNLGKCGDCGELTEPCCGAICSEGLTCVADTCGSCGSVGEPCCDGGCDNGLSCNGATCEGCGSVGEPCCDGGCDNGLSCNGATCEGCGSVGEPCCDGGCDNGLSCNGTACQACGSVGEPCCDGGCDNGLICDGNSCKSCGGQGQPCCGTSCGPFLECSGGTCANVCGYAEGPCCFGINCDGDMLCNGDTCIGYCFARCHEGSWLRAIAPKETAEECILWSNTQACNTTKDFNGQQFVFGDNVRVLYNDLVVLDTHDCGEAGEDCCVDLPECQSPAQCKTTFDAGANPLCFPGSDVCFISAQQCQIPP